MKLKVSPDNVMISYFCLTILIATILPWININVLILPYGIAIGHIIYWIVFYFYTKYFLKNIDC